MGIYQEDFIDSRVKKLFFTGVRAFYCAVATTIVKKFPFKDSVLHDVAYLFSDNRATVDVAAVSRNGQSFSSCCS